MSTKSLSINSASGADSTQAQEQAVKSFSSSSSNLNNASEREQSSSLELPSASIKGVANNVEIDVDNNEVEEFDLKDYALTHFDGSPAVYVGTYGKYNSGSLRGVWLLTLPPLPITMSFWQCAPTFTEMRRTPNLWRRTSRDFPVSGTPRDLCQSVNLT